MTVVAEVAIRGFLSGAVAHFLVAYATMKNLSIFNMTTNQIYLFLNLLLYLPLQQFTKN
jgi:hypothetical protein